MILVSTKSDLNNKIISDETACAFAKAQKLPLIQTSALKGSNILAALELTLQEIRDERFQKPVAHSQKGTPCLYPGLSIDVPHVTKLEAEMAKQKRSCMKC